MKKESFRNNMTHSYKEYREKWIFALLKESLLSK